MKQKIFLAEFFETTSCHLKNGEYHIDLNSATITW